jgi:LacI family transcriptional regulator
MRHTTINDLAKLLKLSPSTVSRALRDHPDISKETKEKVLAMAAHTSYQPNIIAQSLQNRRSNTIGVIVPEIRNTFFSTVISGIEEVAYQAGYIIVVCQSGDTYARESLNIKALAANRVAGMLVSTSQETTDFSHLRTAMAQGIPLVFFDRIPETIEASKVIVDDFEGAYGAVRHLIERGYKRIAHLAGTPTLYVSRKRNDGYRAALRNYNREIRPEYIITGGYHEEDGRAGAEKLLSLPEPPDAIFTINDPVAIGAFLHIQDRGMVIPEQIALVGFSNNPNTALVRPRLTTVNQPAFEIGRTAARLLLKSFYLAPEKQQIETIVLKTELIVRESS